MILLFCFVEKINKNDPLSLQLLAGKDEALLVRRDAFLILNLCLHIVDGVAGLGAENGSRFQFLGWWKVGLGLSGYVV